MVLLVGAGAWLATRWLGVEPRAGWLVALALFTPSTGFILDSLRGFGLGRAGEFWTKSLGIGAEILALAALFVVLQSTSIDRLGVATLALLLLVFLIPAVLRLFATRVARWAPYPLGSGSTAPPAASRRATARSGSSSTASAASSRPRCSGRR